MIDEVQKFIDKIKKINTVDSTLIDIETEIVKFLRSGRLKIHATIYRTNDPNYINGLSSSMISSPYMGRVDSVVIQLLLDDYITISSTQINI